MTTTPPLDLARLNSVTDAAIANDCSRTRAVYFLALNPQTARLLLDQIGQLENPWQTIETAPRDGTYILLSSAEAGGSWIGKYVGQYQSGYVPENKWASMMLNHSHLPVKYPSLKATHWMPLPAAPKLEQTK